MGRLLHPGIGEYADRLTILQLKCERAPRDASTEHFERERAEIQMRVDTWQDAHREVDAARLTELTRQLRLVNTTLWELEDQMADHARYGGLTPTTSAEIADVGIEIWRTNQRRNQIIDEINHVAGTDRGREKF